jgi:hypothetical protein
MEDDFQVIIDSLGNTALSWIPEVRQIRILPDEEFGTAHMEIELRTDDWKVREAASDKIVELRSMFLDELSLDYCFVDGPGGDCGVPQQDQARQFVFA